MLIHILHLVLVLPVEIYFHFNWQIVKNYVAHLQLFVLQTLKTNLLLSGYFYNADLWCSKFYIKSNIFWKGKTIFDFHLSSSQVSNINPLCTVNLDFKVQVAPVFTGIACERLGISVPMWSACLIVYFCATPTLDIVIFNWSLFLGK